jgi:hypothetical protein
VTKSVNTVEESCQEDLIRMTESAATTTAAAAAGGGGGGVSAAAAAAASNRHHQLILHGLWQHLHHPVLIPAPPLLLLLPLPHRYPSLSQQQQQ